MHARDTGEAQLNALPALGGRATDLALAEEIVGDAYLPNRLDRLRRPDAFDMRLVGLRFGRLLVGRLTYGTSIRVRTVEMENVHVNIPIAGRASSTVGSETVEASAGEAAVFAPGMAPAISWSEACTQLCLMVPLKRLELELEHLLGWRPAQPLALSFSPHRHDGLSRALEPAIQLMTYELNRPSGLAHFPAAGRHVEALALSSLLLTHTHNFTEQLLETAGNAPRGAVARAVELINEFPEEAWTTSRLASQVHVSVRALQEGFRSQLGESPVVYLKRTRLARVHEVLSASTPSDTTVQAVATRFGFLHMGRFAAAYKERFHESPSYTLRAPIA